MAGPSRPLPAGIYRVRPLRPVRPPLASGSHAGRGADTPATCVARVGTVTTGSAPAFGRALAPCYGSDLLPLRLRFALQLGDPALRDRPTEGGFPSFARPGRSPKLRALCAPCPCRTRPFWRGGLARTRCSALVYTVATISPWGNCVGARIETPRASHSARARFLIAPCRTAPESYYRAVTTPLRGAGDICLPARDCSQSEGTAEPASTALSPVARDYPSRALRGFFMPATPRLFHQRTGRNVGRASRNVTVLFCTSY